MKILTDFTAGELSEKFLGRPDLAIYQRGALEITNAVPFFPGGVTIRPGFEWIGTIGLVETLLHAFIISPTLSYVLEFTSKRIRIWENGSLLKAGGEPITIVTPFTDMEHLQFAQDSSKLFIASGIAPVQVLEMTTIGSFTFGDLQITGNEGKLPFQGIGNYPKAIALHDGCLWLAATESEPQSIWRSKPFDYGNFTFFETISSTSKQLRDPANLFTGTITEGSDVITGIAPDEIAKFKVGDTIHGTGIPYVYPDTVTRITSIGTDSITIDHSATATGTQQFYSSWYNPTIPEYEDVVSTRDVITSDNAFKKTIASDINETILWLASGGDLIIGTTCGERVVPTGSNAVNFVCKRQTANGACDVQPIMFMNGTVFCGQDRKSLLNYVSKGLTKESQAYEADRLDIIADHILSDARQLEYQSSNIRVVWVAQNTGDLIGCVFDTQTQVTAFFHVVIDGAAVESVAVVPEDGIDTLYACTNRGGTRSLQRMGQLFDRKHLDEYTTRTVASSKVTGLNWLSGPASVVYFDKVYEVTVIDGVADIPGEVPSGASVLVGRPFKARIKTLPTSQNPFRKKQIPKATVRVLSSYPFSIGYDGDLSPARITGPFSGDIDIQFGGGWDTEGCIVIEQQALPVTILAIALDINNGG